MAIRVDLAGKKYNQLTVVEFSHQDKRHKAWWECRCDCGNLIILQGFAITSGHAKSCGCIRKKQPSRLKHGLSNTKEHNEWRNMIQRCTNPNNKGYKNYGGRGITMCDRWMNSFEAFYEDVSKLPHFGEKGYSLDRIDNNGNYEPNNVRWADNITQANNKSNNHLITLNGETHTLAEWARLTNISRKTLGIRLNTYKWTIEKALTTPVKKQKR